jgi:hypothetical protein
VLDLIDWLRAELHSTDESLLEEWQRLANPDLVTPTEQLASDEAPDVTRDKKAFTALIRNAVWRFVQAIARRDFAALSAQLRNHAADSRWTPELLEQELAPYFAEFELLRTDPAARNPKYLTVDTGETSWGLRQQLVDPEEELGFSLELSVDLAASRELGAPVLRLDGVRTE